MRLTKSEISAIKNIILTVDPQAEVYLYGSRVDDTKRGGDIDLLVMSRTIDFNKKITISSQLFNALDEQKVDLLIASDESEPFTRVAREKAIKL